MAFQVFTVVERRLYTGRGAQNESCNRLWIRPHLEIRLIATYPNSRRDDDCAPQSKVLEYSMSACGLGVESSGIDEEHIENGLRNDS